MRELNRRAPGIRRGARGVAGARSDTARLAAREPSVVRVCRSSQIVAICVRIGRIGARFGCICGVDRGRGPGRARGSPPAAGLPGLRACDAEGVRRVSAERRRLSRSAYASGGSERASRVSAEVGAARPQPAATGACARPRVGIVRRVATAIVVAMSAMIVHTRSPAIAEPTPPAVVSAPRRAW